MKHILLPTASRAEFIVTTPSATVKEAKLDTRKIDTGPTGDNDTTRTLALLTVGKEGSGAKAPSSGADDVASMDSMPSMPATTSTAPAQLFDGLDSAKITAQRTLYFSEVFEQSHRWGERPIQFYITVLGAKPKLFNPDNPPAIVTTQGAVEEVDDRKSRSRKCTSSAYPPDPFQALEKAQRR